MLDGRVVKVIEVIDTNHLFSTKQFFDQMGANESRSTSYHDRHLPS
jgi:hypothetical protein